MAEESEKRFEAIMDKLFHAPTPRKSLPSSSSVNQSSRGSKRPNAAMYSSVLKANSRGNLVEALSNKSVARETGQVPLCRPWDRGDLMKRFATFKSMRWFAKPQVVNAVNCALRGWINVDADTIACEACGARLFFSTPSTWMHHQVEKAALVFSLKLDSGHKLLCPWIDNACDETLAHFPPIQAEVLVDEYKKRFSALMHLLALPVISASAINRMKSPLLKHFLGGSSDVECSNESAEVSGAERLGNDNEIMSSRSYHQAQKLISLCGWEPRLLPYIVDCKNHKNESIGDGKLSDLSRGLSHGHCSSLVVSSSGKEATIDANSNPMASEQYHPSSAVLDCRLCGASVGLWAFFTVPQPLEFLRVVGSTKVGVVHDDSADPKESAIGGETEASGSHDLASVSRLRNRQSTICTASTSATPSAERGLSLNLTIAGGPPPTKQNFKATVSLPVIGRNLRARFSSDPDFRDRPYLKNSVVESIKHGESTITGTSLQPKDVGLVQGKQVDGDPDTSALVAIVEEPGPIAPVLADGSSEDDKMLENGENLDTTNAKVGVSNLCQTEECSMAATCDNLTVTNGKTIEGDNSITTVANNSDSSLIPVTATVCSAPADGQDDTAQHLNVDVQLTKSGDNSTTTVANNRDSSLIPVTATVCSAPADNHDGNGIADTAQHLNVDVQPTKRGENFNQLPSGEAMEFDPIGQHRPFCPWIASANNSLPGWQQVLSALHRQHDFSCPSGATNASSSYLIEVDDPITSIRKLFTPPSTKRTKLVHDSS